MDIGGGLPEDIADAPAGRGGSWAEDGSILFTPTGGATVLKVAVTGGAVTPLTKLDTARGENAHYWPVVLWGGLHFLYFARSTRVENSGIISHASTAERPRFVSWRRSRAESWPAGHRAASRTLLWVRDGDLLGQPFDIDAGVLRGEAATIAQGVRVEESQRLTFASASRTGIVAWATATAANGVFALYSRDGRRVRTLDIPPGDLRSACPLAGRPTAPVSAGGKGTGLDLPARSREWSDAAYIDHVRLQRATVVGARRPHRVL